MIGWIHFTCIVQLHHKPCLWPHRSSYHQSLPTWILGQTWPRKEGDWGNHSGHGRCTHCPLRSLWPHLGQDQHCSALVDCHLFELLRAISDSHTFLIWMAGSQRKIFHLSCRSNYCTCQRHCTSSRRTSLANRDTHGGTEGHHKSPQTEPIMCPPFSSFQKQSTD